MNRAAKSLKASVGPWKSSRTEKVFGEAFERGVEIERGVDDPFQVPVGEFVPHERGTHGQGDFREGHGGQPSKKPAREDGNGFRQEQAAVLAQALRTASRKDTGAHRSVRAVVFHRIIRGFSGPPVDFRDIGVRCRYFEAAISEAMALRDRSAVSSEVLRANSEGPEPEMLHPSAPAAIAACLTSRKPGIRMAADGLDDHVLKGPADQFIIGIHQSGDEARDVPHWVTASLKRICFLEDLPGVFGPDFDLGMENRAMEFVGHGDLDDVQRVVTPDQGEASPQGRGGVVGMGAAAGDRARLRARTRGDSSLKGIPRGARWRRRPRRRRWPRWIPIRFPRASSCRARWRSPGWISAA